MTVYVLLPGSWACVVNSKSDLPLPVPDARFPLIINNVSTHIFQTTRKVEFARADIKKFFFGSHWCIELPRNSVGKYLLFLVRRDNGELFSSATYQKMGITYVELNNDRDY